jgi:hypothetical protein
MGMATELKGHDVIQKNWQELIKPNKLEVEPGDRPARKATLSPSRSSAASA